MSNNAVYSEQWNTRASLATPAVLDDEDAQWFAYRLSSMEVEKSIYGEYREPLLQKRYAAALKAFQFAAPKQDDSVE